MLDQDGRWRLVTRSSESLGRYWMHSWAEHLVYEPGATAAEDVTWLVTRNASFRKFSQPDGNGVYQRAAPTDEMRTLTDLSVLGGSGWELASLDGTVQRFDASGRWTETEDRHGNTTAAVCTGADLTGVTFPDGRSLAFTYAGGKLNTITETGSDGVTSRTWEYTWSGNDLQQIDRPDGRSWVFEYSDPAHPGYDQKYDPYVPTFWPATVPNQVLTADAYDAMMRAGDLEERLRAFNRRAAWVRLLTDNGGSSTADQMMTMVRIFGSMGLVAPRPGPKGDPRIPSTVMVEDVGPGVKTTPAPAPALAAAPAVMAAPAAVHAPSALADAMPNDTGWASAEEAARAPLPVKHHSEDE